MSKWYHRRGRNLHHRRPRSLCTTRPDVLLSGRCNLSVVGVKFHSLWHQMFGNMNAEQIFEKINSEFLDPDFEIILKRKESQC